MLWMTSEVFGLLLGFQVYGIMMGFGGGKKLSLILIEFDTINPTTHIEHMI